MGRDRPAIRAAECQCRVDCACGDVPLVVVESRRTLTAAKKALRWTVTAVVGLIAAFALMTAVMAFLSSRCEAQTHAPSLADRNAVVILVQNRTSVDQYVLLKLPDSVYRWIGRVPARDTALFVIPSIGIEGVLMFTVVNLVFGYTGLVHEDESETFVRKPDEPLFIRAPLTGPAANL